MRWQILEPKRKIVTENMRGHSEDIEMSGEQVSGIIRYGADAETGALHLDRKLVFPSFRVQPNNTHGSYLVKISENPLLWDNEEIFQKAILDGTLTLESRIPGGFIRRCFFPSATLPAFYEQIEITAETKNIALRFQPEKRIETRLGCAGYLYAECFCDERDTEVPLGQTRTLTFSYTLRFANGQRPTENNPLAGRRARVEELLSTCDLSSGNEILDTEFAFAKIRAGESLFRTKKGLIHCPGGASYYAAVWCNDQCEYAAPFFALTGDPAQAESMETAFSWYEPYMNDAFHPIPSSIIAEGFDYWNGAGDRGDAAMYLYGLSRFLLLTGKSPSESQLSALRWCVEYIRRKITEDGVVFSHSDELEGRISSGVNLSTSSLACGGLSQMTILLQRLGYPEEAEKAQALKQVIEHGIEIYFGAEVGGYHTYRYHAGCDVIRAWNCLPIYMKVASDDRVKDTLHSIAERLWQNGSCRTTEGETVLWDRSALYYMASLFKGGESDMALEKLLEFSTLRLLGERVPYPVEAYPEGNMRHLSAESALYCRIFTDGLLDISVLEEGPILTPHLPTGLTEVRLDRVYLGGHFCNIRVWKENGDVQYTMENA